MSLPLSYPIFKAFVPGTNMPLVGGNLETYAAGTATAQAMYTDASLSTPHSNPIPLDSNGEIPGGAWPNPLLSYKLVLRDSAATLLWTLDNWSVNSATALSVSGFNATANGSMEIWQAGTSFVGNNGAAPGCFLADGWAMRVAGGAGAATDYTISRQASGRNGAPFCMRAQRNAASTATHTVILLQNLESVDSVAFQGQYATLSFWVRSGNNASGIFPSPQLITGTGTDESFQTGGTYTGQVNNQLGSGSAITPNNQWVQYLLTTPTPLPTTLNQLAIVFGGITFAGTAGANDYWDIADVQLEVGQNATPFQREDFNVVLRRAQRRYYKSFPYSIAPVQNGGTTGAYVFSQILGAGVANQITASLPIPGWMRDVAGTGTTYNPLVANAQIRNTTVVADCAATGVNVTSNEMHLTFTTAAGSAAGNENRVHYTLDKRF